MRSTTADDARVGRNADRPAGPAGRRADGGAADGRQVSVALPTLPGPRTVGGPWRLVATVALPAGDTRVERTLQALADWRQIPGLEWRSGTGVYTATVDVPARWTGGGRGVLLDAGPFGGALRVWVNGRPAPGAPIPGERPREVTALLRPGRNTLRLEITTTLNNAVRAQALLGDPEYASYLRRPVQAAGLRGPIRLLPYAEAAVGASQAAASPEALAG